MTFILRYWEIVLAAIVTAAIAWMLHSLDVQRIESKNRAALATQQAALEEECALNKRITEESSREYESKINALNIRLNNSRRMRENYCIVPIAGPTNGGLGVASSRGHVGSHGVPIEEFYDYAGTCERLRIQVISLQDFIDKTYAGVN